MPRYIIKLEHEGTPYYLEFSTVVDAPVTFGMSLKDFKTYYRSRNGEEGMIELPRRLARVEEKGTSSLVDESVEALLEFNRAGKNETCLTIEQIVEWYCLKKTPCEIEGKKEEEE